MKSPAHPERRRLARYKEAKPRTDTEPAGCVWGVLKSSGSTGPLCLSAEKNSGRGNEIDNKWFIIKGCL